MKNNKKNIKANFITIMTILALLNYNNVIAQKNISELSIGDKCPDFEFVNLYNYENPLASLSDFKDKPIILNFWATWCGTCVSELSKLNEIQKKFENDIKIISVTKDSLSKVMKIFDTIEDIVLPTVYEDSVLNKFFPYRIVPHLVWIDGNGIVKAITSHNEVSENSIDEFIQSSSFSLLEKKDLVSFKMHHSIISQVDLKEDDFLKYSFLTGHIPGISSHAIMQPEEDGLMKRFFVRNQKPVYLFNLAFTKGKSSVPNRKLIRFELEDSSRVFKDFELLEGYKWIYNLKSDERNLFCYELVLPKGVESEIFYQYILNDLNRFFDIKGIIRKEWTPSWVITKIDPELLEKSEGGEVKNSVDQEGFIVKKMHNQPISNLADLLNRFYDTDPFIDETGITYPVDLDLNLRYKYPDKVALEHIDINSLRSILRKQGLDITHENRKVDVLIITDKPIANLD